MSRNKATALEKCSGKTKRRMKLPPFVSQFHVSHPLPSSFRTLSVKFHIYIVACSMKTRKSPPC